MDLPSGSLKDYLNRDLPPGPVRDMLSKMAKPLKKQPPLSVPWPRRNTIKVQTTSKHQVWKQEGPNPHTQVPKFQYTIVVLETKLGQKHLIQWPLPSQGPFPIKGRTRYISRGWIEGSIEIPREAYLSKCPPDLHIFDGSVPMDKVYIKRPNLAYYRHEAKTAIAIRFLEEARTCEIIMKHPHPHVAGYLGAERSADGYLTGLCFEKCAESLLDRLSLHCPDYCDQHRA